MFIDQIIYPIEALGPGKRIGIWVVGCNRACVGCSNPELWSTEKRIPVPVYAILHSIESICGDNQVDGFTITGGEPMLQAKELDELVSGLQQINQDILVFSGFTFEELAENEETVSVLEKAAVLVDGPYIERENRQFVLRGSANQRILLLNPEFEDRYVQYLNQQHSKIQNLHFHDMTVSVGIHSSGFAKDITKRLLERGVRRADNGSNEMA